MGAPPLIDFAQLPPTRSLHPWGAFRAWFWLWVTAAVCCTLPLLFVGLVAASIYGTFVGFKWLGAYAMEHPGWLEAGGLFLLTIGAGFCLLLLRQLIPVKRRDHAWLPVLPLDQRRFHDLVGWVSRSMRMRMPDVVAVDPSALMQAETSGVMRALMGRGLNLRVGLCLAVGLTTRELAGLMAHELAFFKAGRGAAASRLIRRVDEWFLRRIRRDAWDERMAEEAAWEDKDWKRLLLWLVWFVPSLAGYPLRALHQIMRWVSTPALRIQVQQADETGARLAGSVEYAMALQKRAALLAAWRRLEAEVASRLESCDLPDNLPLLLAREMLVAQGEPAGVAKASHWLSQAQCDEERVKHVLKCRYPGYWPEGVVEEATEIFANFHELARRATMFHYQNELQQFIPSLRFLTVEEIMHERRASQELLGEPRRYFRGLVHPERACCGIAEIHASAGDAEALKIELLDCREYINHHCHQMAAVLAEWSKMWRMVRELEAALAQKKAGMHVHRHQLAMFSAGDLIEEIERCRLIMDNMEAQLRAFEGRLETRMACCLELLLQAPEEGLPATLIQVRQTLPHWVLVYEALGMHMPVVRELLTSFGAFQALGATVSGRIDSASYVTTAQQLLPRVVTQVMDIAKSLSEWPYPFQTNFGDNRLTMTGFLSQRLGELEELLTPQAVALSVGDRREVLQLAARKLVCIVAPFMDRYLNLYHQAFAWMTRVMQMAEWHFADPLEGAPPEEKPPGVIDDEYNPSRLIRRERVDDPEAEDKNGTLLAAEEREAVSLPKFALPGEERSLFRAAATVSDSSD